MIRESTSKLLLVQYIVGIVVASTWRKSDITAFGITVYNVWCNCHDHAFANSLPGRNDQDTVPSHRSVDLSVALDRGHGLGSSLHGRSRIFRCAGIHELPRTPKARPRIVHQTSERNKRWPIQLLQLVHLGCLRFERIYSSIHFHTVWLHFVLLLAQRKMFENPRMLLVLSKRIAESYDTGDNLKWIDFINNNAK